MKNTAPPALSLPHSSTELYEICSFNFVFQTIFSTMAALLPVKELSEGSSRIEGEIFLQGFKLRLTRKYFIRILMMRMLRRKLMHR